MSATLSLPGSPLCSLLQVICNYFWKSMEPTANSHFRRCSSHRAPLRLPKAPKDVHLWHRERHRAQRRGGRPEGEMNFSNPSFSPAPRIKTSALSPLAPPLKQRRRRSTPWTPRHALLGRPPGGLGSHSRSRVQPRGGARSVTGQAPGRAGEPLPEGSP